MRGADRQTALMFSYISPEGLVPRNLPLRVIRSDDERRVRASVASVRQNVCPGGRDSVAPERLLRALLLQFWCSVRSGRQLMVQITYTLSSAGSSACKWTRWQRWKSATRLAIIRVTLPFPLLMELIPTGSDYSAALMRDAADERKPRLISVVSVFTVLCRCRRAHKPPALEGVMHRDSLAACLSIYPTKAITGKPASVEAYRS